MPFSLKFIQTLIFYKKSENLPSPEMAEFLKEGANEYVTLARSRYVTSKASRKGKSIRCEGHTVEEANKVAGVRNSHASA